MASDVSFVPDDLDTVGNRISQIITPLDEEYRENDRNLISRIIELDTSVAINTRNDDAPNDGTPNDDAPNDDAPNDDTLNNDIIIIDDDDEEEEEEVEESSKCPICLGKIRNKSHVEFCDHWFCFECLKRWSDIRARCPMCKIRFTVIMNSYKPNGDCNYFSVPLRWNFDDDEDDVPCARLLSVESLESNSFPNAFEDSERSRFIITRDLTRNILSNESVRNTNSTNNFRTLFESEGIPEITFVDTATEIISLEYSELDELGYSPMSPPEYEVDIHSDESFLSAISISSSTSQDHERDSHSPCNFGIQFESEDSTEVTFTGSETQITPIEYSYSEWHVNSPRSPSSESPVSSAINVDRSDAQRENVMNFYSINDISNHELERDISFISSQIITSSPTSRTSDMEEEFDTATRILNSQPEATTSYMPVVEYVSHSSDENAASCSFKKKEKNKRKKLMSKQSTHRKKLKDKHCTTNKNNTTSFRPFYSDSDSE